MKAIELKKAYIKFFKLNRHVRIPSAPLIPENDPTVLFTTAGMHPLVPYLSGAKHPAGNRLVNCQKCVRTGDIDEVGDTTHLTFFEMLGNWSLGNYFKEEAITLSFRFLTEVLNISVDKLWVSCFEGDDDAPRDTEAAEIWEKLGMPKERIVFLDKKHNWWGPAGLTGPCGPDTEMFIELDQEPCSPNCDITCNCGKFVEIWNDVFMQYNKKDDGTFEPLAQQNVDTGMGVERVTAILQGKKSCFETEVFSGLFQKFSEISNVDSPISERSGRIVVEHIRAAVFLMSDGVRPGNVDQSYVLRRLIRRAIREARKLGVTEPFTHKLAQVVISENCDFYPELTSNSNEILQALKDEEQQFAHTLEKGLKEFNKLINAMPAHVKKKVISGRKAFNLYETYGFPLELTIEMATEHGFSVDEDGFNKAYKKHQEQSRAGASEKFKGGLADNSEQTTALHTATHLLHTALRTVLGEHVKQAGSNITEKRLRFDFSHPEKVNKEQLTEVEAMVNKAIADALEVTCEELTVDDATAQGAIGLFTSKYGEKVKVYSIGNFSKEICGGPHVQNTKELGTFKIKKESSSSRGIRRIKAVLTK